MPITQIQLDPYQTRKEVELWSGFWNQVNQVPDGQKIKSCIQCGTCTGSCPVSFAMDITPREVVGLFRAGMLEEILHSKTIWICASCYSCTVRCPSGIRVTDTLYALKRLAMEQGIYPKRFPVHALSRTFIDNIYKYGRNFELGLGAQYLMRTSPVKLLRSAGFGMKLLFKGRISLRPKRIKRVGEVRAIIDRAKELGSST